MTIIDTPSAPHPKFGVRYLNLNLETGTGLAIGEWLDAAGQPVDSGNSVVRFLITTPLTADQMSALAADITTATA